jgi:hypothetical protein
VLDRQDIDALLVGALYGELSSTDEAALTAHLDSHPADRNALDDLKSIRTKFQTSRIFELQFEPPQALSALLLQEAARRAPKIEVRKESWFQRFVTLFVAHPAMAAAATLVLVVGVAGTVYVKSDKQVEVTASQGDDITRLQPPPTPASAAVAWGSAAMGGDANADVDELKAETKEAAGDALHKGQVTVAVGLAEEQEGQNRLQDTSKDVRKNKVAQLEPKYHATPTTPPTKPTATTKRDQIAFDGDAGGKHEAPAETQQPAKKAPAKSYVEVGSTDRTPKDFERGMADDKVATSDAPATGAAAGPSNGAPGNARSSTAASNTVAKPAQNAPVVAASPAAPEPPPPPAANTKTASRPDPNLAWAKDTHARVTALVKEGKCQAAAPLAIAIRNRTPDYYNSYVATDRELKPCMPYITDATEHSERSSPKAAAKATDTK